MLCFCLGWGDSGNAEHIGQFVLVWTVWSKELNNGGLDFRSPKRLGRSGIKLGIPSNLFS
jgi:hypothetical protein